MLADVLCAGLPALLEAAGTALPDARPLGLGVVRAEPSGRVLFVYIDAFGSAAYRSSAGDLPAAFHPRAAERIVLAADELSAHQNGLVESRLLHTGLPGEYTAPLRLQRIVTQPVVAGVPAILVVGFGT